MAHILLSDTLWETGSRREILGQKDFLRDPGESGAAFKKWDVLFYVERFNQRNAACIS